MRPLPMRQPAASAFAHDSQGSCPLKNVGDGERWLSMLAGASLVVLGLSSHRRGSMLATLLGGGLVHRGATGRCRLYSALGVDRSQRNSNTIIPARSGYRVEKTVVINRPASELYGFWRDVENLPKVMSHINSVEAVDRVRSHWIAEGILGKAVEWDAEIFNDKENELIAWRSLPGGDIDTAGCVRFTALPEGHGTEVSVELKYDAPLGKVGAWLATLAGANPDTMVAEDLRRFKTSIEAGEASTTEGQFRG